MAPPRQQRRGSALTWSLALAILLAAPVTCEEAAPADAAVDAAADVAAEGGDENDPTKQLLKQLTISMVSEVVDERTILIRDAAKAGRKLLRMGNTASLEQGSLSEAEYEDKVEGSKSALRQLVGKQMIWWKAAADEFQPKPEDDSTGETVIVDMWLMDGRHINSLLVKEGHLEKAEHYQEDLARNILTAESEEAKKKSYKELEEAIKESQKYKAEEAAKAKAKAEAEMPVEGIGIGGWVAVGVLVAIVLAVIFLAPEKKKKVNLNRKRGFFDKLMSKLKGS